MKQAPAVFEKQWQQHDIEDCHSDILKYTARA